MTSAEGSAAPSCTSIDAAAASAGGTPAGASAAARGAGAAAEDAAAATAAAAEASAAAAAAAASAAAAPLPSASTTPVPAATTATTPGDAGEVLRYCDFRDFLQHLGIDPLVDAAGLIMVAAHHMFASPLPPHWTEQIDEQSSRVYFFNKLSGDSLWVHPQAAMFKEIIEELRQWPPDDPVEAVFERSETHLRKAHQKAVEVISQWSAHDAPQGPEEAPEFGETMQFFYNSSTGESKWVDPRQAVEYDLRQRHTILCRCLAAHTQNLSRMVKGSSSDSSDGEGEEEQHASVQALISNLWHSIGSLPLPAYEASTATAPPEGVARPVSLPAGDDTVRSSVSYLTARSSSSYSPRLVGQ